MERRVPVKEAQRREEILNVNEPRGVPAPITKIGLPAAEAGTLIQEISGLMTNQQELHLQLQESVSFQRTLGSQLKVLSSLLVT